MRIHLNRLRSGAFPWPVWYQTGTVCLGSNSRREPESRHFLPPFASLVGVMPPTASDVPAATIPATITAAIIMKRSFTIVDQFWTTESVYAVTIRPKCFPCNRSVCCLPATRSSDRTMRGTWRAFNEELSMKSLLRQRLALPPSHTIRLVANRNLARALFQMASVQSGRIVRALCFVTKSANRRATPCRNWMASPLSLLISRSIIRRGE